MTIKEFLELMLQTAVNGFHTFLGGLAPFAQWLIYLCAGIPVILLGLAAYFWIIKPAREDAVATMTAFGKDTWKAKLRIAFWTCVGVLGTLFIIWIAPRVGNAALVVAADGMNFTPAAPPINGAANSPILEIPSLTAPSGRNSGGESTPSPDGEQLPPPTLQSGGTTYKVSDSTGATTRTPTDGVCTDNDPKTGSSIPFGTVVTIVQTWPSTSLPGLRGLTSTGLCVHLSALTQQ